MRKDAWERLVDVLRAEAKALGGYGELTVRITLHDGQPRNLDVVDSRTRYRVPPEEEGR